MAEGNAFNILLVEDDPAHAEITMRIFQENRFGNYITHLTDGKQALDYMFRLGAYSNPKFSPRPHLILMDLRLPKIDGLEVLQRIKSDQNLQSIPVIILTTSDADVDIARAYNLNVNSYLVKPLEFNKFTKMIEDFGFYWMVWNKFHPSY